MKEYLAVNKCKALRKYARNEVSFDGKHFAVQETES